ncbi:uncharacterized protein C8R40DRAFT_1104453 [Lentinula edodes]|uniref:uncharacterized protein n=1 Tax=Lentinula edodes TaxID=5353 RepID=UPI001E8D6E75|nr:uncharacterized protein C8R40DRAFT_1104453 [Lentinula edodes]KAH7875526.1 hypothetical protein C8R40DRAFT_1104453 [Lentinula edodes]
MENYLPINAISAVILVSGKIDSKEQWTGPKIPVVLYRQDPPPANILDDAYTREGDPDYTDSYPPCPSPLSDIPSPAGLTLHISLGKLISEGRTGMIYECECAIPHGNEMGYKIPPMVIKIAKQFRTKDITKEAAAYECMTCIQGSVVPRCYGFFQARMFDYFDFGPVSLLVLEKLGDLFELGEPLPNGAMTDMKDACSDLTNLRIIHGDLRWANMLSVLEGGLPSLPSPFTGKTYGWRLIDFDRAERTTQNLPCIQRSYDEYLNRVLESIPWGDPVEPWD